MAVLVQASSTVFTVIVIAGGLVFIGKETKFEKTAGDGVHEK